MILTIPTPSTFNFKRTVISHGWCELLPFAIDRERWILCRTLDLGARPPVTVTLSAAKRSVQITTSRTIGKQPTAAVLNQVRHILRLDDDLKPFYQTMKDDPEFAWVSAQGAGRMLQIGRASCRERGWSWVGAV